MNETLLNMIPNSCAPEVHLSQYDNGRVLRFVLKEGNAEYQAPSGAVVKVKATKPSGLGFIVSGTISDGNIVTVTNTETMTNEAGRFPAELSITSGTTLLGTSNFVFNIERSPHPEGTIDGDAETLLPELTLLVERIEDSNARIESMTASATPLPSGQNPTATYDSTTNNLDLGIPVADRQYITVDGVDYAITSITKTVVDEVSGLLVAYGTDSTVFIPDGVGVKNVAQILQAQINGKVSAIKLNGDILTPHYDSSFGDGVVDLGTISDDTKADAIVKTASGSIASFSDGGDDLPMKSLKVNIVPKQSGSGDPSPSNVRPISGWDAVDTNVSGKNLFKNRLASKTKNGVTITANADGTITLNGTSTAWFFENLNYVNDSTSFLPAGNFVLSGGVAGTTLIIYADGNRIATASGTAEVSFTISEEVKATWIRLEVSNGITFNNNIIKPMVRPASMSADYEPYEGETITTNLGQTVYSGVLDVLSGELVIDKGYTTLGAFNWDALSSPDRSVFRANPINIIDIKYPETNNEVVNAISNTYIAVGYGPITPTTMDGVFAFSMNAGSETRIVVIDKRFTTINQFKAVINDIQVVFELANPIAITLTPTEVKSLLGANNIWADAGTVEVEYRADTTLAYNELLNLIANM